MKQPKIGIVGLGAIGGAYASMAFDQKIPVYVICDLPRKARYLSYGYYVNEEPYEFKYVFEANQAEELDLIIVAVKHQQLEEAIEMMEPFISENTIVISLLNGIRSEEIISKKIKGVNIISAFTAGLDGQREGNSISFSSKGKIYFGAIGDEKLELVEQVKSILDACAFPNEMQDNMLHKYWWKFMMNVGINQASALLQVSFGAFKEGNPAYNIANQAMREVLAIANKLGISLIEKDIDAVFELMASLNVNNKPSTLQDLESERLTEVDLYAGEVIRLGQKLNIPTPVNKLLFQAIKHMEAKYKEKIEF